MVKEVRLKDERKIKVYDNENAIHPIKQITESFSVDGLECAHYSMIKGEIFTFNASLELDLETEENKNILVFDIDIDHPLYFPLLHLLQNDKELIINDVKDDKNMKYLSIKNDDDLITLNFIDKNRNEKLKDRFVVVSDNKLDYLKNIMSLKNNDIKKRINDFFDEACEMLFEDYHQINFEEYTLKKTICDRERKSS